jgi:rod shape-determining protein MreD
VALPSLPLVVRAVLIVLAALASVTVVSLSSVPWPDLVLPVVVAGALRAGASRGALLGLAGGWLVDLMPPGSAVLGTAALLYAAAGLLVGAGRREGATPFGWVALVGTAGAVVVTGGRVVVAALSGASIDWAQTGARLAFTSVLCALVVPVLVAIEGRLGERQHR